MTFGNTRAIFFNYTFSLFANLLITTMSLSAQYTSQPFDIIISEIMADPTPVRLLPDCEYIELYNRSDFRINLLNWCLYAGSHKIILPDTCINPGEFAVVSDAAACQAVSAGKSILIDMPHISNTGQVITLKTPQGLVIHSVNYCSDWYNNPDKNDGGWSVEMIDTDNPCGGKNNWKASENDRGGTPGAVNSVCADNRDLMPPVLMNAALVSDSAVLVHFTEPLYYSEALLKSHYSVDNGFLHPSQVLQVEPGFCDVILTFNKSFGSDVVYTLTLLDDLTDCAGNHPDEFLYTKFATAESAEEYDVIINEILSESDQAEFVEIYNRSQKVIDISTLCLSIADESGIIDRTVRVSDLPFTLFPHQYLALTRYPEDLLNLFKRSDRRYILAQPVLFALPDDGGFLVLSDTSGNTIDELEFSLNMHHDLILQTEGISIERVNSEMPSSVIENWQSASSSSGFGTPGLPNSQSFTSKTEETVSLLPELISPDGDGIDDEIFVRLNLAGSGWNGTINIYDFHGNKIRTLASNSLLGTQESLCWDGKDDGGNTVVSGIYILYGELFNTTGEIKNFKKVIPVVKK